MFRGLRRPPATLAATAAGRCNSYWSLQLLLAAATAPGLLLLGPAMLLPGLRNAPGLLLLGPAMLLPGPRNAPGLLPGLAMLLGLRVDSFAIPRWAPVMLLACCCCGPAMLLPGPRNAPGLLPGLAMLLPGPRNGQEYCR